MQRCNRLQCYPLPCLASAIYHNLPSSVYLQPSGASCQAYCPRLDSRQIKAPAQAVLLLVLGRRLVLGLDLPAVPKPLLLLGSWQIHLHNWTSYD